MGGRRKVGDRRAVERTGEGPQGQRAAFQPDFAYTDPLTGIYHVVQVKTATKASDPKVIGKVKHALENEKFKWRTIRGISKETGIEDDVVKVVIANKVPDVMVASDSTKTGETLFTTRKHYKESSSLFERVVGVLKNRAA